jgi:TolB protein
MRIRNTVYPVGEGGLVSVRDSGSIQFMVNDDLLSDNRGLFIVHVEIPQGMGRKSNSMVFSSRRDGNQEIYLLDLKTGRATNLTQASSDDGYPRCAPDGRTIAFTTNREGHWEIYLMNRDGSRQRNLTRNTGGSGYMDWSPDGQTLVFASAKVGEKNNDLYSIRVDGGGLRKLTNDPAEDVHPAWSPDGKRIAFASERAGNRQIYIMSADGSHVTRIMTNRSYDDYPAWSPDGSLIAFSSDRDSRSSQRLNIYTVSTDGSRVRRLTSDPADDRHPAWSADGTQLAFSSNRNGDRDIFVMRADGTGPQSVASALGDDEHPSWCAESTTSSERTWTVRLTGAENWHDTGIAVARGDTINIKASGRITWNPNPENNNSTAGPDGVAFNAYRLSQPQDFPMPEANIASLLIRVGGVRYAVGSERSLQVSEGGTIQLMINDRYNGLSDNFGDLNVVITLGKRF